MCEANRRALWIIPKPPGALSHFRLSVLRHTSLRVHRDTACARQVRAKPAPSVLRVPAQPPNVLQAESITLRADHCFQCLLTRTPYTPLSVSSLCKQCPRLSDPRNPQHFSRVPSHCVVGFQPRPDMIFVLDGLFRLRSVSLRGFSSRFARASPSLCGSPPRAKAHGVSFFVYRHRLSKTSDRPQRDSALACWRAPIPCDRPSVYEICQRL